MSEIVKQKKQADLKLVMKGSRTFMHHMFKLTVAKFMKNTSFEKDAPKITELEHCHIFHSCDKKGNTNEFCTPTGGHIHRVTQSVLHDGTLTATCSPPIKVIKKLRKDGSYKKEYEQIKWYDKENGQNIADNHIHVVEYTHSEEMSAQKMQAIREDNAARIGSPKQNQQTNIEIIGSEE